MATAASRKRSALKGHHLHGTMVTYADGTEAFRQDVELDVYHISDDDCSADPSYFGYVRDDGSWYILKMDEASNTYRYFAGTSAYATGWTNRAAHSYGYYDVIF